MHPITIRETLLNDDDGTLVLASDANERPLVGVSPRPGEPGAPAFVQIDRVTMLELERGVVDMHTALTERCAGIVVPA
ncbi:MAG TPA: hypothetical protein VF169_20875 [Albitalea sp.]|uniref:hypothetical protein n=1 Tax=Piscinibacter sp. TaxID=1903157 RepID=UPI002ED36FB8